MKVFLLQCSLLFGIAGVGTIEAVRLRKKIEWPTKTYQKVDQGISLNAEIMTQAKTKELFNGRGKKLLGNKPIIPVQVTLTNESSELAEIKNISSSFTLVSDHEVKQRMKNSLIKTLAFGTLGVAVSCASGVALGYVGFGVGGLLGWALVSSCPCPCAMLPGALWGVAVGSVAGTYLGGYYFFKRDTTVRELSAGSMTLQPGETRVCYLFTKDYENLTTDFSVAIV